MDTTHQQEGGDTQNTNIAGTQIKVSIEGIEPQVAVQETPENLNNNHETKNFVEDKADQNNVEESKVFHVPLSESNDDPDENYQPTNTPFIENGVPIGSERPPMNYVDYILQRTQMGPIVKDIPTQILDCLKEDNLDQLQKMNFKKNTPPDENQQNNDHKEPENNHASSQGEGESGADSEKQDSPMDVEIDPSCIFRKGDGTGRYLIHAAIIYSAYDCLNYLFSLIQNWDDVFIDASWELDSYTFLHICAFTLFYHSEASELPKSAEVGQNKKRVNTQKAVKIMELLLTNSKFSTTFELNAKDRLGCTVLHYLAMCPIPEVVDLFKICTEKGADYEFKDRELNAPIHIAIKYHNPECFKFLVSKYNAKLFEVEDFHGYNLITVCIQEFSWECLTELVKV